VSHHHSHHESHSSMSFEEKVIKLLEHWLKHNNDHAGTYREWAGKAREAGLNEIAGIMESAAASTEEISGEFEKALNTMKRDLK